MDIQSQNFFFLWVLGGGYFSTSWTKVAGNYMKGIDSVSELFPSLAAGGWETFLASWTKVAGNCMKWIDSVSEFFPSLPIGRGGGSSAQFSGMIIFSIELYYGDQLCSKCMKKSFVSYLVNEIQAYKYNILMTLQSVMASTVTVIAGILVCIMVRLPKGLPPAPWSCVLYFCICEYFEKLRKLVT